MWQNFWHLISGEANLYVDIVEPIGYEARRHNDSFNEKRAALQNRLVLEFTEQFCRPDGQIDWPKLVQFNSGNLPGA
jgi:hypothetical protein